MKYNPLRSDGRSNVSGSTTKKNLIFLCVFPNLKLSILHCKTSLILDIWSEILPALQILERRLNLHVGLNWWIIDLSRKNINLVVQPLKIGGQAWSSGTNAANFCKCFLNKQIVADTIVLLY